MAFDTCHRQENCRIDPIVWHLEVKPEGDQWLPLIREVVDMQSQNITLPSLLEELAETLRKELSLLYIFAFWQFLLLPSNMQDDEVMDFQHMFLLFCPQTFLINEHTCLNPATQSFLSGRENSTRSGLRVHIEGILICQLIAPSPCALLQNNHFVPDPSALVGFTRSWVSFAFDL